MNELVQKIDRKVIGSYTISEWENLIPKMIGYAGAGPEQLKELIIDTQASLSEVKSVIRRLTALLAGLKSNMRNKVREYIDKIVSDLKNSGKNISETAIKRMNEQASFKCDLEGQELILQVEANLIYLKSVSEELYGIKETVGLLNTANAHILRG